MASKTFPNKFAIEEITSYINEKSKPKFECTKADLYFYRANFLLCSKKFKEALSDYNKSIGLDPSNYIAFYRRGKTKANMGDHHGAIDDYNVSIDKDYKHIKAYHSRAFSREMLGHFEESKKDINKVIELETQEDYLI